MSKPLPAVEQLKPSGTPKGLLPCPFCGEDMSLWAKDDVFPYFVRCIECGTEGPSAKTEKTAIRKWNTRV